MDDRHQVAARAFSLALSLSLAPAVLPLIRRPSLRTVLRILRRDLGWDGFPFAITVAVAGAAYVRRLWPSTVRNAVSDAQRTFVSALVSSSIGMMLLQAGARRNIKLRQAAIPYTPPTMDAPPTMDNKPSPTLDLTLVLLVRAVDAAVQLFLSRWNESQVDIHSPAAIQEKLRRLNVKSRKRIAARIDALVFWACSARIMMCWFYAPHRLPQSYVKWIRALAGVDGRLLDVLRLIRHKEWSYIHPTQHRDLLRNYSKDLGYSSDWGDPTKVPAFGGPSANVVWDLMGVTNRQNIGGVPCELVHGGTGRSLGLDHSCTANAALRGLRASAQALAIYTPVHFLPALFTRPRSIVRPHKLATLGLGALRSTAFLSAFISSFWFAICFTRSIALARLLPYISHDFWDSPYGCILAGSTVCGGSILIENPNRRGEMALYVLPRAIRSCLPDLWLRGKKFGVRFAEKVAFATSLAFLLTAAMHYPTSLRGLSRWTLAFIINGPSSGFWKRKRLDPSIPPTPSRSTSPLPAVKDNDTQISCAR